MLTACTPVSALSPALGNKYGKTLPFSYLEYWPTQHIHKSIKARKDMLRHHIVNFDCEIKELKYLVLFFVEMLIASLFGVCC